MSNLLPTKTILVRGSKNSNPNRDGILENGLYTHLVTAKTTMIQIDCIRIQSCYSRNKIQPSTARIWLNPHNQRYRMALLREIIMPVITPSAHDPGAVVVLQFNHNNRIILDKNYSLYISFSVLDDSSNQFDVIVDASELI